MKASNADKSLHRTGHTVEYRARNSDVSFFAADEDDRMSNKDIMHLVAHSSTSYSQIQDLMVRATLRTVQRARKTGGITSQKSLNSPSKMENMLNEVTVKTNSRKRLRSCCKNKGDRSNSASNQDLVILEDEAQNSQGSLPPSRKLSRPFEEYNNGAKQGDQK